MSTKRKTVWLAYDGEDIAVFEKKPTRGNFGLDEVNDWWFFRSTSRNKVDYPNQILGEWIEASGIKLKTGQAIEIELRPVGKPV
jgi:hypothetical protein